MVVPGRPERSLDDRADELGDDELPRHHPERNPHRRGGLRVPGALLEDLVHRGPPLHLRGVRLRSLLYRGDHRPVQRDRLRGLRGLLMSAGGGHPWRGPWPRAAVFAALVWAPAFAPGTADEPTLEPG